MNHVLFDCERTKFPNTGLFHFCLQLGNALLAEKNSQLEDFTFFLPQDQLHLFGEHQQTLVQRRQHKFYLPATSRYQVWHSTYQNSNYRPFNKKTRVVLTVHDLNFIIEKEAAPEKIKRYLRHVQKNIDRADHIVCISAYTRRIISEHLQLNSKPVDVIYNGCNIHEFPGFDAPAYRPGRPFIFTIGTVFPKKNFHVLPCLLKHNDYELVIAGIINKDYETRIREEAAKHGVSDRVTITGPVSEQDKYWYYAHCDAFAFPSLAEGFGFPVVEAMYYGKPVFISNLTSLPEIGGEQAYYFNNFDPQHMQQVFASGMEDYHAHHRADAIRARALEYNWTNAARSYLSVYRSLYK